MRYLLDMRIIGNIVEPVPSDSLLAWMAERDDQDLFITSLTMAEIRRGILEKPAGCSPSTRRRNSSGRG
jgi:predicted nucleic acid-binding protein